MDTQRSHSLQAGGPGKSGIMKSESKGLRTRILGACPGSSREHICPSSTFLFSGFDDAHPHWWKWSSLPSLLTQTLIFPENILTNAPRNNILSASWTPLGLVGLTQKTIISSTCIPPPALMLLLSLISWATYSHNYCLFAIFTWMAHLTLRCNMCKLNHLPFSCHTSRIPQWAVILLCSGMYQVLGSLWYSFLSPS